MSVSVNRLVLEVQRCLEATSIEPWWPGLSLELAQERLGRLPFDYARYTTSRFLGLNAPLNIISVYPDSPRDISLTIEIMSALGNGYFAGKEIEFAKFSEITPVTLQTLSAASSLIGLVPSLASTVSTLVRSIHVVKTDDPDIDVSFSDPAIPFSIFLSLPSGRNFGLRAAEAIIHEAMHLQLSLVEEVVPLVLDDTVASYSPWKKTLRPLSGIVHALYVFRVIDKWLEKISLLHRSVPSILRRRAQIAEEVLELNLTGAEEGFTQAGKTLISKLLYSSDNSFPTW